MRGSGMNKLDPSTLSGQEGFVTNTSVRSRGLLPLSETIGLAGESWHIFVFLCRNMS